MDSSGTLRTLAQSVGVARANRSLHSEIQNKDKTISNVERQLFRSGYYRFGSGAVPRRCRKQTFSPNFVPESAGCSTPTARRLQCQR